MNWMDVQTNLSEKREKAVAYIQNTLGCNREIVFGCDNCDSTENCPYCYDPYNMDDDCLAEK